MRADLDLLAACASEGHDCSSAAKLFLAIVEAGRKIEGRARLGIINRAVNLAIQTTSDIAQHGAADVWSSPLETFRSGKGDCEDYAIAKFAALLLAGVPAQDLRLVVIHKAKMRATHAVLAAQLDNRWLVLDNRRHVLIEEEDVRSERAKISCGWQSSSGMPWCTR
jgi:predicted transglutaminase-like cysteine proteinase